MQTQHTNKPRFIWIMTLTVIALLVSALSGVLLQAQDTVELSCYNRLYNFAATQDAMMQTQMALPPPPTTIPPATLSPAQAAAVQSTATSLAQGQQVPFVGPGMTATGTALMMPLSTQPAPFVGPGMTATAAPTGTMSSLPMTGGGGGNAPVAGRTSTSTTTQPTEEPLAPQDMFFENYGINPFVETTIDNLSTFAMDVDTASYTLTRNYLLQSYLMPDPAAIRPEEFINYFPTNYGQPEGNDAFALYLDAAPSPFRNDGTLLMRVGLQGRSVSPEDREPVLLIFVVDVSGSMGDGNRMETVKDALRILVGQMRQDDYIGIVTFSDYANRLLEPVTASRSDLILNAIDTLQPTNSTNAEAGICYGYQMASENLYRGLNTRVIFLSDGVANVGFTQPEEILDTIEDAAEQGITLTSIGVGMGNFNDVLLEQIANNGEGNYYYVDNVREARRVFVNNLVSTLQVIAYDARIQVEFNPDTVSRYRLIGYENRAIADAEFRADATVDAAEIGAGHTITALYEVVLNPQEQANGNLATAFVRYEDVPSRDVVEVNATIGLDDIALQFADAPDNFRLLAAVAEFAEMLRQSPFAENTSYADILEIVTALPSQNPDIGELAQMIATAEQLSQQ